MSEPKTILVTGASRGIGLLTVRSLAQAGHHVFAAMRDLAGRNKSVGEGLTAWASAGGYRLETIEMDVTDESSVNAAVAAIEARQPIDVLVNNAGIMPVGMTEAYSPEQVRDCLDINLVGVARCCRAVLPGMRARRAGLMIHVSSNAGRLAIPFFGLYCASKWALEAYAESLHYELRDFGIESIILEPGGHSTDLVRNPPAPADRDCIAAYGRTAEGPGKMLKMFEVMFSAGEKITDAQNVADRICGLVAMPNPRPLRTTVGHDMGVDKINAATAPLQADLIQALKPVASTAVDDERLFLFAGITLKPEHYREGRAALEGIIPATLAEPGCHVFSLMESREDDGKLYLFEIFEDEAALQSHYAQDYTKAVFARYEDWLAEPVEIRKMNAASAASAQQFH